MVSVPLEIFADPRDPRALQAWVDAEVDGTAHRLLLDTGSSRTSLSLPACRIVGTETQAGYGLSGTASIERHATVRSLRAGQLEVRELVVSIQPEDWGHPPLLGTDVFRADAWTFSFSRLRVEKPAVPDRASGWHAWEASTTPSVKVRWGTTRIQAVWDTGSGITIVDRSWAQEHSEAVTIYDEARDGTDITGTAVPAANGRLHQYSIAGRSFPAASCGVVDLSLLNAMMSTPVVMFLGLPEIRHADWHLNFPRRQWAFADST